MANGLNSVGFRTGKTQKTASFKAAQPAPAPVPKEKSPDVPKSDTINISRTAKRLLRALQSKQRKQGELQDVEREKPREDLKLEVKREVRKEDLEAPKTQKKVVAETRSNGEDGKFQPRESPEFEAQALHVPNFNPPTPDEILKQAKIDNVLTPPTENRAVTIDDVVYRLEQVHERVDEILDLLQSKAATRERLQAEAEMKEAKVDELRNVIAHPDYLSVSETVAMLGDNGDQSVREASQYSEADMTNLAFLNNPIAEVRGELLQFISNPSDAHDQTSDSGQPAITGKLDISA